MQASEIERRQTCKSNDTKNESNAQGMTMNKRRARSELKRLQRVRGVRQAAQYLGLSYSELARELSRLAMNEERAHPTGKRRGLRISKSSVGMWAIGATKMPKEWIDRTCMLIANHLTSIFGQTIGVVVKVNSPWRVTAKYECRCGRWHYIDDDCSARRRN